RQRPSALHRRHPRVRVEKSIAGYVPTQRERRTWRTDVLRRQRSGFASPCGDLCGQGPEGCQARRSSRRATHQVRADHQPQDRQGAQPHHPAVAAAEGGSGHRIVNRRAFVTGLGAVLAAPVAAEAQRGRKLYRIGVLGLSTTSAAMAGPDPQNAFAKAFVRGMRELGYTYGQDFVTETRGAEGKPERYPSLVADLVRLPVDVIVAVAASVATVKRTTSTSPVGFPRPEDPRCAGPVTSLPRPCRPDPRRAHHLPS